MDNSDWKYDMLYARILELEQNIKYLNDQMTSSINFINDYNYDVNNDNNPNSISSILSNNFDILNKNSFLDIFNYSFKQSQNNLYLFLDSKNIKEDIEKRYNELSNNINFNSYKELEQELLYSIIQFIEKTEYPNTISCFYKETNLKIMSDSYNNELINFYDIANTKKNIIYDFVINTISYFKIYLNNNSFTEENLNSLQKEINDIHEYKIKHNLYQNNLISNSQNYDYYIRILFFYYSMLYSFMTNQKNITKKVITDVFIDFSSLYVHSTLCSKFFIDTNNKNIMLFYFTDLSFRYNFESAFFDFNILKKYFSFLDYSSLLIEEFYSDENNLFNFQYFYFLNTSFCTKLYTELLKYSLNNNIKNNILLLKAAYIFYSDNSNFQITEDEASELIPLYFLIKNIEDKDSHINDIFSSDIFSNVSILKFSDDFLLKNISLFLNKNDNLFINIRKKYIKNDALKLAFELL